MLCCIRISVSAQNTNSITVNNHPSVSSLIVNYDMTISQAQPVIRPNVTLVLKPGIMVSNISLTMLRKQDSTVLYQVSYALNAAPVNDSTGRKLFFIKDLQPVISIPLSVPLDTYIYKVRTLDALGVTSPEFIGRQ